MTTEERLQKDNAPSLFWTFHSIQVNDCHAILIKLALNWLELRFCEMVSLFCDWLSILCYFGSFRVLFEYDDTLLFSYLDHLRTFLPLPLLAKGDGTTFSSP